MSGAARELKHVKGLKELKSRLNAAMELLEESVCVEILAEVGELLTSEARNNLPSHWLLAESIGYDVEAHDSGLVNLTVGPRHGFETEIGDPAEYGIYHEFGINGYKKTPKPGGGYYYQGPTTAKQYLRRAIEENEQKIVQIIADRIMNVIGRK